jgi:AcrR family transcriptional regulator
MPDQVINGVQVPQQARSRKTFDNILAATERLMDEKPWGEILVKDIVAQANCSNGSFYARFKDKRSVLACLSERLSNEAADAAVGFEELVHQQSLTKLIPQIVEQLAAFHNSRIGLIRTLTLLPRLHPEESLDDDGIRTAQVFRGLVQVLVAKGVEVERAEIGLFFVVNAIREKILFPAISGHLLSIGDREFLDGLSRAFSCYVTEAS